MVNQLLLKEMVAAVERERMVDFAQRGQVKEIAQGGRNGGPVERAKKLAGALLQRMGRPLGWGSAPAGGRFEGLNRVNVDGARHTNQSMSIARY